MEPRQSQGRQPVRRLGDRGASEDRGDRLAAGRHRERVRGRGPGPPGGGPRPGEGVGDPLQRAMDLAQQVAVVVQGPNRHRALAGHGQLLSLLGATLDMNLGAVPQPHLLCQFRIQLAKRYKAWRDRDSA